jgi:hypothetical protein
VVYIAQYIPSGGSNATNSCHACQSHLRSNISWLPFDLSRSEQAQINNFVVRLQSLRQHERAPPSAHLPTRFGASRFENRTSAACQKPYLSGSGELALSFATILLVADGTTPLVLPAAFSPGNPSS